MNRWEPLLDIYGHVQMELCKEGDYVLYKDLLAAIAEKDREIERIQTNIDVMKRALRWSECEEDGDG